MINEEMVKTMREIPKALKSFVEDVIAESSANDGIKKAVQDQKVAMVTDELLFSDSWIRTVSRFVASQARKAVSKITVYNPRNVGPTPSPRTLNQKAMSHRIKNRSKFFHRRGDKNTLSIEEKN